VGDEEQAISVEEYVHPGFRSSETTSSHAKDVNPKESGGTNAEDCTSPLPRSARRCLFNYFNRFNNALQMEPTRPGDGAL
jgi:hypothetical protein